MKECLKAFAKGAAVGFVLVAVAAIVMVTI